MEKEKKKERLRPGGGNIWKKKYSGNSKNKTYDYMKNDYSGLITETKSNKNAFNKNNSKNLFTNSNSYINLEYTTGNISKRNVKNQKIDKNKLFADLYKKTVNKLNDPYGKMIENNDDKNGNTDLAESIYNQPIEYGKAIDILHNKLYSINFDDDEDDK